MSNGKGSSRRPHDVPTDTVSENWARTFGGVTRDGERVTVMAPDITCDHPHVTFHAYANWSGVMAFRCTVCGKLFS